MVQGETRQTDSPRDGSPQAVLVQGGSSRGALPQTVRDERAVRDEQVVREERAVLEAIKRDDAYQVLRVLSDGASGRAELVMRGDDGPYMRKRYPLGFANTDVVRRVRQLDEPLLPHIVEDYELPDCYVVVRDWVAGTSLADRVSQGRMALPEALAMMDDLCRAVGALHSAGVVHRDLTPGNVVLARDGAHVIDLGIARIHVDGATRDTTHLGTWGFAAPEQFGFAQTDARSDVYSLGRLLGYALTGIRPDDERYEAALADRRIVPASMGDIVRRASAFEPSARYQSVDALARALHDTAVPEDDTWYELAIWKRLPLTAKLLVTAPLSGRKAASVIIGVVTVFAAFVFLVSFAQQAMAMPVPIWQVTEALFGFAFVMWGLVFTGQELIWLLMGYGEYAGCPLGGRLKRFCIRIGENLLTGLALMYAASILANMLYGPMPEV